MAEQAPAQHLPTHEAPAHASFASEASEPVPHELAQAPVAAPVYEPAPEPVATVAMAAELAPQAAQAMHAVPAAAAASASVEPAAQAELPLAPVAQATPAMAPEAPAAQQPAGATAAEALPVEQLRAVVETAGLQWVQSDPERVEQARRKARQAPVPRHAPRERKPRAAQDEGPLVLVETRKALPRLDLPENEQPAP